MHQSIVLMNANQILITLKNALTYLIYEVNATRHMLRFSGSCFNQFMFPLNGYIHIPKELYNTEL